MLTLEPVYRRRPLLEQLERVLVWAGAGAYCLLAWVLVFRWVTAWLT